MLISLTFDDGYKCQFDNALPILDKYQIKGTFYIITKYLFQDNPVYMNRVTIETLFSQGHEIGAHTVSHPNLTNDSTEEIGQSMEHLNSLGFNVKSFAYPYTAQNKKIRNLVKKCGFENARAGAIHKDEPRQFDDYAIGSFFVKNDTSIDEIRRWITNAEKKLLVIGFHEIKEKPSEYGCKPDIFEQICLLISASAIKALPLSDAVKEFRRETDYA